MIKIKKMAIILVAISSYGAYANMYPDSVDTNLNMPLDIRHKVNGSMVGGNPLLKKTYGEWSSWETTSFMTNCTPWTPDVSTVRLGEEFIQTTVCEAEETRTREVTYHYEDGSTNVVIESDKVITKVDDEDEATGTKDYITGTDISYSTWYRKGTVYDCTEFTPDRSTVEEGKYFTQSQTCSHDYVRYKYTNNTWASGATTEKSKENEYKTDRVSRSRNAIGTKKTANYVWRRTGEIQVQPGGNARNGATCPTLGVKALGPTAEAGTVTVMATVLPRTYLYECVNE